MKSLLFLLVAGCLLFSCQSNKTGKEESEKEAIINRWTFSTERGWKPGPQIWQWIALGVIVVLLLVISIYVWDLSVKRRAEAKTKV
jgi:ABC-type Fe3+ transport system permease subunit